MPPASGFSVFLYPCRSRHTPVCRGTPAAPTLNTWLLSGRAGTWTKFSHIPYTWYMVYHNFPHTWYQGNQDIKSAHGFLYSPIEASLFCTHIHWSEGFKRCTAIWKFWKFGNKFWGLKTGTNLNSIMKVTFFFHYQSLIISLTSSLCFLQKNSPNFSE